jgi:hypothetical protein
MGLTSGNTEKTVLPTSPREVENTPNSLIGMSAPVCLMSDISQQLLVYHAFMTYIARGLCLRWSPVPKNSGPNMRG